jgi:hypothetical protein
LIIYADGFLVTGDIVAVQKILEEFGEYMGIKRNQEINDFIA